MITTAANGIGRATSDIIAREGDIVIAIDNHQKRLDGDVDTMVSAIGRAHGRLCDALDQSQVEPTVRDVVREFGKIDIL